MHQVIDCVIYLSVSISRVPQVVTRPPTLPCQSVLLHTDTESQLTSHLLPPVHSQPPPSQTKKTNKRNNLATIPTGYEPGTARTNSALCCLAHTDPPSQPAGRVATLLCSREGKKEGRKGGKGGGGVIYSGGWGLAGLDSVTGERNLVRPASYNRDILTYNRSTK